MSLTSVVVVMAITQASDFNLHLLNPAIYPEALCLDGTQGGYYFRKGSVFGTLRTVLAISITLSLRPLRKLRFTTEATKFKIHICGGGWCYSEQDCGWRSKTNLGSSSFWPPVANTNQSGFPGQWNLGLYGLLGNDTSNTFKDWNAVFIMYCDGSSFTSYREAPLNGLHYRGRKILDGVISELLLTHRMDAASEVILSGTSAGGMATYVHANLFRSVLPVSATMAAVPDAGYWFDSVDLQGKRRMRDNTIAGISLWNTSTFGPGNDACMKAHAANGEPWKCYLAQYLMPFITPPVMVVNALYDPAQYSAVLGLSPGNLTTFTPKELAEAETYRGLFQAEILSTLTPKDGAFLTACNQHEETCRQPDWEGIIVGGTTMMNAITDWYLGKAGNHTHVDCGPWAPDKLSCNPTCVSLPMHGAC